MKRSKRPSSAPTPDMVSNFLVTLGIVWNSYAVRLGDMLDHYGPDAFHEDTYAMLRSISKSLTPSEHLEHLEAHMLEVKGLGSPFVGGVGVAPPTQSESTRLQSRVNKLTGAGPNPFSRMRR